MLLLVTGDYAVMVRGARWRAFIVLELLQARFWSSLHGAW
jgi:hypothetical protein